MRQWVRARITYANVMATIAVFVALGGTSYAVKRIGSKEIADNSIRTRDIHDRTLLRKDFKAGQLLRGRRGPRGARGRTGRTGKTGKTGARGRTGAAGLSGVTTVTADSPLDSNNKTATAQCPSGKRAVGGGATLKSGPADKIALAVSAPDGNPATGWKAGGLEVIAVPDNWQLTVHAVCATVAR
jgi:hypothetical protein